MCSYDMNILAFQGREYASKGDMRIDGKLWEYRRHLDEILRSLDIPPPGGYATSRPTGTWGHFLLEGERLYLRAVMTYAPSYDPGSSTRWVLRCQADGFAWDWSRGGFLPDEEERHEYTLTEPVEATYKVIPVYETAWHFRQEPMLRLRAGG